MLESDPRKDHVGLFVYVGVVLCTTSINGWEPAWRDLHSGNHTAGGKRHGGVEPDGKGVGRMSVKEFLKDLGLYVLGVLPVFLYALFFYFI